MASRDSQRRATGRLGSVLLAALLSVSVASAHIEIATPDGGESFEVGSIVSVVWEVLVYHEDTQSWDVLNSTAGLFGEFVPIETGLPPDDFSVGAVHVYDWTVADTVSDAVRILVRHNLSVAMHQDTSDLDFSIVPLQSVSRLRVATVDRPFPDLGTVFSEPPCTRISELRICAEAPGAMDYDDPVFPLTIPGDGDLVLIQFDSLLAAPRTPDQIYVSKGPSGTLIIDISP
jgi:hypothetical protein